MSAMLNFGHQHLQRGPMLDSYLIPNLRSKVVKCQTFLKSEIKDHAFDHQSWGGGGMGGIHIWKS
jgi:hypothetical protein